VHIQPEAAPHQPALRHLPSPLSTRARHRTGGGGRNDTYGSARTAHPGRSQGRPATNTGSQPIEQERPAHPASLPVPLSRTVAPYADPTRPTRGDRPTEPATPTPSYRLPTRSNHSTQGTAGRSRHAATSRTNSPR
jgi:hypothetical protein